MFQLIYLSRRNYLCFNDCWETCSFYFNLYVNWAAFGEEANERQIKWTKTTKNVFKKKRRNNQESYRTPRKLFTMNEEWSNIIAANKLVQIACNTLTTQLIYWRPSGRSLGDIQNLWLTTLNLITFFFFALPIRWSVICGSCPMLESWVVCVCALATLKLNKHSYMSEIELKSGHIKQHRSNWKEFMNRNRHSNWRIGLLNENRNWILNIFFIGDEKKRTTNDRIIIYILLPQMTVA